MTKKQPAPTLNDFRKQFEFDSVTNNITAKAFEVLGDLCAWFDSYHPDSSSRPNLRVGRELVAVCIGDEALWNSNENHCEELSMEFVIKAYKKVLTERLATVAAWEADLQPAEKT